MDTSLHADRFMHACGNACILPWLYQFPFLSHSLSRARIPTKPAKLCHHNAGISLIRARNPGSKEYTQGEEAT
jgi:hypothetical protein